MKSVALALAVVCFLIAIVYWLPSGPLGHHVKHGIVFAVLGVLALVWMRFADSSRRAPLP
ncbi:MAG: hypothetical protein JO060_10685 [Candidatus Eremiobacteraeota bacterium]|nr:hypothetical protein [Candidatus Eremiobacteraeota bacterium]MBV9647615.1 hypothetical protein [Candidatus Eremiobacteraeota bacterium]